MKGGLTILIFAAAAGGVAAIMQPQEVIRLSCKPNDAPDGQPFTQVGARHLALSLDDDGVTVFEVEAGEKWELKNPRLIDRPSICVLDRTRGDVG